MVNPRTARVFNLYDIIGVFFPGATLLIGILILFPNPPTPSSVWEYTVYLIVAFSLGHVTQICASLAMGELKVFEYTMDETRSILEEGGDNNGIKTNETDVDSNSNNTDQSSRDSNENTENSVCKCNFKNKIINKFLLYILYPILGPFIFWYWSPDDDETKELLHANRVWKNLQQKYAFDIGTNRYEELQQMISSQIDDPKSPSRSYRFQAIRNFHRGMWISMWLIWIFVAAYKILWFDGLFYPPLFCFSDVGVCSPFLINEYPNLLIFVILLIALVAFWWLTVYFERIFIRYLITDYFVVIQNKDVDDENSDRVRVKIKNTSKESEN